MSAAVFAEDEKKTTPAPTLPLLKEVKVTKVTNPKTEASEAGIGDRVEVKVDNLWNLVRNAKCLSDKDERVENCTPRSILLYLEGREIKGLIPEDGSPETGSDIAKGMLHFHLQRNADSDESWSDLLGGPRIGDYFFVRPTAVSVGLENAYPLNSAVEKENFNLIRIRKFQFVVCSILLVLVLGSLWFLAWYTELLRSVGTPPNFNDRTGKAALVGRYKYFALPRFEHKPYSLAQFQMAIWFSLVILAFLYIWLVNGASDTITASTLGLIGIGAGTALGAAAIDLGKNQSNKTELDSLKADETSLKGGIAIIDKQLTPTAGVALPTGSDLIQLVQERDTKKAQFSLKAKRILELKKSLEPKKSDWFLMDVLTDEGNGISFHRFQMFVWTLILGVLFIYQVWYRLSMPDFSTTLLALLGISSGTYLGFKIPEK